MMNTLWLNHDLVQILGQEAERLGLSEEQLLEELKKDKRSVYDETYGTNPS